MGCDLQDLTCNHGIKSTSGLGWQTQRVPRVPVMKETTMQPVLSDDHTPEHILSTLHAFLLQPDSDALR